MKTGRCATSLSQRIRLHEFAFPTFDNNTAYCCQNYTHYRLVALWCCADANGIRGLFALSAGENEIRSLDDLAGLDNEELLEFLGQHGLSDDGEAGDIIMAARAHWFENEDAVGAAEANDTADTGDQPVAADS